MSTSVDEVLVHISYRNRTIPSTDQTVTIGEQYVETIAASSNSFMVSCGCNRIIAADESSITA